MVRGRRVGSVRKVFAWRHEFLTSDPQDPNKKSGAAGGVCLRSQASRQRWILGVHWPASPPKALQETLSQNMK